MDRRQHWEGVYQKKLANEVSWYREHLENSVQMIVAAGLEKSAAIIDVGGGASTLVDDLLELGFANLSVLDISRNAIRESQKRLAERAAQIKWFVGDVTNVELPENYYDLWHDRAVFHFLTSADDRQKYVDLAMRSLKPDGSVIIAVFGENGPTKCSGLDVVRYSSEKILGELGNQFLMVKKMDETHRTPGGSTQHFIYCHCRKRNTRG